MGNMVDSLGFEEVNQATFTETISGGNIYSAGSIVGAKLSAGNLQSGYFVTGTGSSAWVAFATAFATAPKVIVSGYIGTADDVWVNAVATGSFQAYSVTASKSGTYIALG